MEVIVLADIDLSIAEERILAWFFSREMGVGDITIKRESDTKQVRGDDYTEWWIHELMKAEFESMEYFYRDTESTMSFNQYLKMRREAMVTLREPEPYWDPWDFIAKPLPPKPEVPRHETYRNPIKHNNRVMPRMHRRQHR